MVLIVLEREQIIDRPNSIPIELQDFIEPGEWRKMSLVLSESYYYGQRWACCMEWGICICFVFPCIFVCHPCMSICLTRRNMKEKLKDLNYRLFNDAEVLTLFEGKVHVNTDVIRHSEYSVSSDVMEIRTVNNDMHKSAIDVSEVEMSDFDFVANSLNSFIEDDDTWND